MSVRTVLTWVGTAVGAYFGNPQLGYAIGSALGNAVDPEIIKGPSIGDIAQQTSQEGTPRPIVFGLSQPMAGNIIASSEPRVVRKRQRQGKGGPKVETETVYRTYAVGICEGPINRVVRVWRNGELVYDRLVFDSEFFTDEFLALMRQIMTGNNQHFTQRSRFFLGTWDQMPSPDLETVFGVDVAPAHRGTAYMVMADEDLTDLRGAIPQWQFQVERCEGAFVTSRPYALEDTSALSSSFRNNGGFQVSPGREGIDSTFEVVGGSLFGGLLEYDDGAPEGFDSTFEVVGGSIYGGLVTYDDGAPEGFDSTFEVVGGSLFGDLVTYDDYPPEGVDSALTVLGGTLGA